MSGDDMVSQEQFDSLRRDVKKIKAALLGDEEFGQKGFVHMIKENKDRSWSNKLKIDRAWYYIVGGVFVIVAIFKGIELVL